MGGHTNRNRGKTSRDSIRNGGLFRAKDGQRAGPELIHQQLSTVRKIAERFQLCLIMNMDNEGIVRRTALGSKNGENRVTVQGVGAQAVNCFGREGYQSAVFQDFRRQGISFR